MKAEMAEYPFVSHQQIYVYDIFCRIIVDTISQVIRETNTREPVNILVQINSTKELITSACIGASVSDVTELLDTRVEASTGKDTHVTHWYFCYDEHTGICLKIK